MAKTGQSRVPPSVSMSRNRGRAVAWVITDQCLPHIKRLRHHTKLTFRTGSRAGQIRQTGSASRAPKDGPARHRFSQRTRTQIHDGDRYSLNSTRSSRLRKKSQGKLLFSAAQETQILRTSLRLSNACHAQHSSRPHTRRYV